MTQTELNRAVARATGETPATINRLGFLLDDPEPATPGNDAEPKDPCLIDWDALDERRYSGQPLRSLSEPVLA